jgi:hypothetical protein
MDNLDVETWFKQDIILNLELSPIWTNNYSNTKEQPIFKANFIYHQKYQNIIMVGN